MTLFSDRVERVASRYVAKQIKQAKMHRMALRQRTLIHLMSQKGTFGIISAYTSGSKSENQTRHGQLMADLQRLGYRKITTLRGQWEGVSEKSVLVQNMRPNHLFPLGVKYGQDATIYKSNQGVVGMYYPQGMYAEVAVDPATLLPSMDLSDDKDLFSKSRNWSFNLGFLWGQKIPWDGRTPISPAEVENMVRTLA